MIFSGKRLRINALSRISDLDHMAPRPCGEIEERASPTNAGQRTLPE